LGVILLAATKYEPGVLDAALKETIGKFAVDPSKIGIFGRGVSGASAMRYGTYNPDVFSRIGSISGGISFDGMDPKNTTVEYFIEEAVGEHDPTMFWGLRSQRQAGVHMEVVMNLRGLDPQAEDYDFWGRWLQKSWANPNPDSGAAPQPLYQKAPELTSAILQQMTTFWTSFMQEPDSILQTARLAHLREVVIPNGGISPSVGLVDMVALAAQFPSVAADLKRAGLTAEQHDAYRIALLIARFNGRSQLDTTSTVAKNIAFWNEYSQDDKVAALDRAGIWNTP
jgi:hypothetical protein